MKEVEEIVKKFKLEGKVSPFSILRPIAEIQAENEKLAREINETRYLINFLIRDVKNLFEETIRWKTYYETYSKFYAELEEFRNMIESILFTIRALRKEKTVEVNTLIRIVGEKRKAFTTLLERMEMIESQPFEAKLDALEALKEIIKERFKEEKEEVKEVAPKPEEKGAGGEEKKA